MMGMRDDDAAARMDRAIRITAPGQPLRAALDMIVAGHLGALICVGDEKNVIALGNDGFPLDIAFTGNRLFELAKMDGAIVIDEDLTKILRANFHLNPDATLATSETGMRHRTAARMSQLTHAIVISVSERRGVVHVYVDGENHVLQSMAEIMGPVNQLVATLQTTRNTLDRSLLRLSTLELDNYVTLGDITRIFYNFQILEQAKGELEVCIEKLGDQGDIVEMQLEQLAGPVIENDYTLMIRDYAVDSSEEYAQTVRERFASMPAHDLLDPECMAEALGYGGEGFSEDTIMTPQGLRTLSQVSVVREGVAESITDEYGSLQEFMADVRQDPSLLDSFDVKNPEILVDTLERMQSRKTDA